MAGPTYTFHRCIGRGGFGEVYLATRHGTEGIDKRVAVKVLRPDLPNAATALKRLRDEGRMLAALAHPAIVHVLELTRLRGRIALVTEYVDGADLSRFCAERRLLPPRVALTVIGVVAGALDTAWNTPSPVTGKPLALVHRDIKPENVRLSKHGEVKLLDFGIARSTELAREARTTTGNLPFTPGYTAPEAFVAMQQGAPTDVFALGATLYRLIAGERFYEGVKLTEQAAVSSTADRYQGFLDERLARLPTVGVDVASLLATALAYAPGDRPTAAALERRCEALADELPGPVPRRWVRTAAFPDERDVGGAALTGLTLSEDRPEDTVIFARGGPPPVPAGLVHAQPSFGAISIDGAVTREPRRGRGWWVAVAALCALGVAAGTAVALVLVATGVWMTW